MQKPKPHLLLIGAMIIFFSSTSSAQLNFYRTNGAEIIFSGADVSFNGTDVNTNMRFTAFFHGQQMFNMDVASFLGFYTGFGIRNIGLITDDLYQNMGFLGVDEQHLDWNKQTKIKRRSYALSFPAAIKIGNMKKQVFAYAGASYEWMFHYKQKLFIDGEKYKFSEWASDRVNAWIPSFFAGLQFPGGMNLKFKMYMDDFLNPGFTGIDFGENVDYSTFGSTNIYYISFSTIINKNSVKKMMGSGGDKFTQL